MAADPYRYSARWYDRLFESLNKGLRVLGLRMHRPRRGMAVLDVGCGTGAHLEIYQRFHCQLVGLDPSPAMLAVARRRLDGAASLQRGDAAHMPYGDGAFDLVLCMLSLHEMDPATRAAGLGEMARVVKPGGRLLLIDYHPGRLRTLQAWRTQAIILLAEVGAGRRHFRNYRGFLRAGGLPALLPPHHLALEDQRIVADGPLALCLVRPGDGSTPGG
jgi:ubiquinone/menaquinone biosynthesis C-methylase UbiE